MKKATRPKEQSRPRKANPTTTCQSKTDRLTARLLTSSWTIPACQLLALTLMILLILGGWYA